MKILFITPRLPHPLDRGDRIRVFNFAKTLSREHSLSLISLIQSEGEKNYLNELKKIFGEIDTILLKPFKSNFNMVTHLFSALPLQIAKFESKEFGKKIKEKIEKEKFDIIYTFHLRTAQYFKHFNQNQGYKILDLTDCVSSFLYQLLPYVKLYLKPIIYREWLTTKKYETEVIKYFNECWLISNRDKENLGKNISSPFKIAIIPNGVDTEYFSLPRIPKIPKELLFITAISIDSIDAIFYFYEKIFPLIKKQDLSVIFHIIGRGAPKAFKKLQKDKNVIITDFVRDPRPYYQTAYLAIAPLRIAAGVQNKILEAMAMKLPVITTKICQKGIGAEPDKEILVGETPEKFSEKVIKLLENENLRNEIGENARNFVKKNFTWQKVLDRINEITFEIKKQ